MIPKHSHNSECLLIATEHTQKSPNPNVNSAEQTPGSRKRSPRRSPSHLWGTQLHSPTECAPDSPPPHRSHPCCCCCCYRCCYRYCCYCYRYCCCCCCCRCRCHAPPAPQAHTAPSGGWTPPPPHAPAPGAAETLRSAGGPGSRTFDGGGMWGWWQGVAEVVRDRCLFGSRVCQAVCFLNSSSRTVKLKYTQISSLLPPPHPPTPPTPPHLNPAPRASEFSFLTVTLASFSVSRSIAADSPSYSSAAAG